MMPQMWQNAQERARMRKKGRTVCFSEKNTKYIIICCFPDSGRHILRNCHVLLIMGWVEFNYSFSGFGETYPQKGSCIMGWVGFSYSFPGFWDWAGLNYLLSGFGETYPQKGILCTMGWVGFSYSFPGFGGGSVGFDYLFSGFGETYPQKGLCIWVGLGLIIYFPDSGRRNHAGFIHVQSVSVRRMGMDRSSLFNRPVDTGNTQPGESPTYIFHEE